MLVALLIALGLGSMDTCAEDHCVSLIQLRGSTDNDAEEEAMLGEEDEDRDDDDEALTETVGSLRRILSEEKSDEEADDTSEDESEDEIEDESEDESADEYEENEDEEDDNDGSVELPSGEDLALGLLERSVAGGKRLVRESPAPKKQPPRKHVDEDGDPDDEEED